jgi:uncharacterized membrane protein YhiD involved in acid resistance
MAVNLNLLPSELAVSKNLGKALKTLRALGIISIVAFLIFAVGLTIFFVVSTISLNGLNNSISQHKAQVAAQESSEQQIVALKDRISKIENAKSTPNALKTITDLDSLLTGLSTGSTINELDADSIKATMSLNIKSNDDLTAFLQAVSASKVFTSGIVSSFSFGPSLGYSIGVTLTGQ